MKNSEKGMKTNIFRFKDDYLTLTSMAKANAARKQMCVTVFQYKLIIKTGGKPYLAIGSSFLIPDLV